VARRGAAEDAGGRTAAGDDASVPQLKGVAGGSPDAGSPVDLDRLIHGRVRLGIVSALAVHDVLSFNDLKSALGITDGNLSVHARKLEEAGYIDCIKSFEGRVPRTEYRLTEAGRAALRRYVDHMESLLTMLREG